MNRYRGRFATSDGRWVVVTCQAASNADARRIVTRYATIAFGDRFVWPNGQHRAVHVWLAKAGDRRAA